ncbi:helix-turn-helix transcriptional regulator [Sandaracinobacteroides hominis]|uniref:helix-turn-helix transcriptional regulator n=1 Tax=Sandaracinobacteroides hominis TaxID=2780086 RepID=UPI0018F4F759|nr:helix-turn-helix transcriptional regulator [Sandaracinobacteroides hominis]
MSLDSGISSLIYRIYAGQHDDEILDSAMDEIVAITSSNFIMLAALDNEFGAFSKIRYCGNISGKLLSGFKEYEEEFARIDPTIAYTLSHPKQRYADTRAILGEDFAANSYTRWSRDALMSEVWHLFYTEPQADLVLGMALHPGVHHEGLTDGNVALSRLLFDHMEHATRLAARPPDFFGERDAIIALDNRGRALMLSPRAERYLAQNDGLELVGGFLRGKPQHRLDGLIRTALKGTLPAGGASGDAVSIGRASGKRPWAITASPLPGSAAFFACFGAAALLHIVDPEEKGPPEAAVRWANLYGFTPAEIRIAKALLDGEGNLRIIADRLTIAHATARVQLASLFEKADVRSQSQLVRLLTRTGG